jgi:hypothetical protein
VAAGVYRKDGHSSYALAFPTIRPVERPVFDFWRVP